MLLIWSYTYAQSAFSITSFSQNSWPLRVATHIHRYYVKNVTFGSIIHIWYLGQTGTSIGTFIWHCWETCIIVYLLYDWDHTSLFNSRWAVAFSLKWRKEEKRSLYMLCRGNIYPKMFYLAEVIDINYIHLDMILDSYQLYWKWFLTDITIFVILWGYYKVGYRKIDSKKMIYLFITV